MRNRYRPVYLIPAVLAVAGPAFLVVVTGGRFLPLAAVWWVVAFAVTSIRSRSTRIRVALALIPVCVLTTFEGGLFMLPAVLALCAIDLMTGTTGRTHARPGRASR